MKGNVVYFVNMISKYGKSCSIMYELELCAFALKGEHNVYSLVPNIAVCMYIYIDTKFIYDNNVYFSIFCEHRQLKHGMHVIVVLCG